MFSGIIKEQGILKKIISNGSGKRLIIENAILPKEAHIGHSIAVNGCCLTIVDLCPNSHSLAFDVVPETIARTSLSSLEIGDTVNLERALQLNELVGGHLIQGHVDGTGTIIKKEPLSDGSWWLSIQAPPSVSRYFIFKGSIAVDGISLTIAEVQSESELDTFSTFSIALIPHTISITNLKTKEIGSVVNLEVDLIAKYVERFTSGAR